MDLNPLIQSIKSSVIDFSGKLLPDYIFPNLWLIFEVVVILLAGYIFGKIGKFMTKRILGIVGLKRVTDKSWAGSLLKITGYKGSIVELVGDLVKWFIYIIFLTFIMQVAGFTGVANVFGQIAIFVPRFIGAILLIIFGFIIAEFFGKIFEEAGSKFTGETNLGKFIGGVVRYTIGIVVLVMSLALVGLDTIALSILLASLLAMIVIITTMSIRDIIPEITSGIQVRNRIKAGDRIKAGGYEGVVEEIQPLVTRLVSRKSVIILPNSYVAGKPLEKVKRR